VNRTTHRVAFTDVGEAYVARGRDVLGELDALERETTSRVDVVCGVVRVSAPAVYGALRVGPIVAEMQRRYAELDVHLWCEDRLIDIVAERIDVAVRILVKPPAEFVARELGEDRRGLYASGSYLARAKAPKHLDELSAHAVIAYSGASTMPELRRGRVVFATDSILAAREAARTGLGVVELPRYLAVRDIAEGRLHEVLPGAIPTARKIYALYLPSRYVPPRVRAVVDALVHDHRRDALTEAGE